MLSAEIQKELKDMVKDWKQDLERQRLDAYTNSRMMEDDTARWYSDQINMDYEHEEFKSEI